MSYVDEYWPELVALLAYLESLTSHPWVMQVVTQPVAAAQPQQQAAASSGGSSSSPGVNLGWLAYL